MIKRRSSSTGIQILITMATPCILIIIVTVKYYVYLSKVTAAFYGDMVQRLN